ncbi:MAG: serine/threonine protein kinase [Deltaproteobacteria bacterium]|nr:MAG: serine/threonine protein kinase [Deltaproteobacteria bacterium]
MSHSDEPSTFQGRRPGKGDPLLGTWLDERFLIEERIATGGFGAIYRARTADGTPLALKVLHPTLTGDPNMVARFQREGATLTQLHDPHTVTTFAVGETAEGVLYIAMELLSGESLHDRLERERLLPWQTAVAIARAVCSSLAEAHALGVVHRDLKPANIHVENRGGSSLVKVIDFGIVKIARGSAIDDGQELTHAGHMIGTYDYMSPEQIVGGECREASDIYSLGVVLYEMLTGRRPFAKLTSPAGMMTALLTQTPQPPSVLAAIPAALDRIVMRCLEREPEHRFPSVIELAATLGRVLAQRPTSREEVTAVHPVLGAAHAEAATIARRTPSAGGGDPDGSAGGAGVLPRGIARRTPSAGGGDPDGSAGGAGVLPRGIDDGLLRARTERDPDAGFEAGATRRRCPGSSA